MLVKTQPRTRRQWAKARAGARTVHGPEWGVQMAPRARYRLLGVHLSRIPDAVYPWDRDIVRAIRVFDPGFVPIFRRKVYRDNHTGLLLTFVHHGIARFSERRQTDPKIARLPVPAAGYGSDFGPINFVERWLEPAEEDAPVVSLPRGFVPFDDFVYGFAREHFAARQKREQEEQASQEEVVENRTRGRISQDRVSWKEEPAKPTLKEVQAEAEYRQKNELAYQKRLMDQLSEDDLKELRARMGGVYREDPKPFVHVRSA